MQTLMQMGQSVAWWIGDAVLFGERKFGEKASQVFDAYGAETIRKYAWVAESIPPSRRSEDLSFTHHQVVASLSPAGQEKWIKRAKSGEDGHPWTVRQLKDAVSRAEKANGHQSVYWLVVGCPSLKDRDRLRKQCEQAGRQVREP